MGGSEASSANTTTTTTTNIADSYNRTYNAVSNLSDVGNVSITLPGADSVGGVPDLTKLLPFAILGGVLIAGVFLLRR